jgi:hypothetical protein
MRRLTASAILLLVASSVSAADLSKVDRTIRNEPRYVGKPEYCLLVFGPDARERVWVVRDGDTLYVDKNGNGDLTESGKKFSGEKDSWSTTFHAGTLRIGKSEHRNLVVRSQQLSKYGPEVTEMPSAAAALKKNRQVEFMAVSAEIEWPGLTGGGDDGRVACFARLDSGGPLLPGASPKDAPIVHFGGPLTIRPEVDRPTLFRGVPHDLMLTVGTPGLGPGTFASLAYNKLIPESAYIVVDAELPASQTGAPLIRAKFELRERC